MASIALGMNGGGSRKWRLLSIVGLVATAAPVPAAPARQSSLERTLTARLEATFHGEIWEKSDAHRFVSEFYAVDAVGTMEGAATVWKGREALTGLMVDVMKTYASFDYSVYSTVATGPKSAYQFVLLRGVPKDPKAAELKLKCLYTWTRTTDGWRVAADMCASGEMDK